MKKVFIIKKYILAESITEAIAKEKQAEIHEVWLEESSFKNVVASMDKKPEPMGIVTTNLYRLKKNKK